LDWAEDSVGEDSGGQGHFGEIIAGVQAGWALALDLAEEEDDRPPEVLAVGFALGLLHL
jgi:hypothetical protein